MSFDCPFVTFSNSSNYTLSAGYGEGPVDLLLISERQETRHVWLMICTLCLCSGLCERRAGAGQGRTRVLIVESDTMNVNNQCSAFPAKLSIPAFYKQFNQSTANHHVVNYTFKTRRISGRSLRIIYVYLVLKLFHFENPLNSTKLPMYMKGYRSSQKVQAADGS